ncbi:hypothetical protein UFOVP38_34 [uncultured Caudovirales phage]|uniref:Uncharacterized protein n=1 Tax=uncultured Caudovirales phage TaxID=2100421 RepID=A0A6J5TAX3_9CAUD|nr:hypothetical protein UFOVP38_34 [uncultured Caudovirales phage]
MAIEQVTQESFEEWKHHPVTKKFMKQLKDDREVMKEGLANGSFDDEAEIKGRCRVIAIILDTQYEDLHQSK